MKTTPLISFLKFYVMRSPEIDLYSIGHVIEDLFPLQKMYFIPILGIWLHIPIPPFLCFFVSKRWQKYVSLFWYFRLVFHRKNTWMWRYEEPQNWFIWHSPCECKLNLILHQKFYVILILGRYLWTTMLSGTIWTLKILN